MNEPIRVIGPNTPIKPKNGSCFLEFLIITATTLLGGFLGILVGVFLFADYLPPWQHSVIQHPSQEIRDILFIQYQHIPGDNTWTDTVIVATGNGDIYSFHQNQWQRIQSLPMTSQELQFSLSYDNTILAIGDNDKIFRLNDGSWELQQNMSELPRWSEKSPCHNWDYAKPPVNLKSIIIDSDGVQEVHTLSEYSRCYILLDDGRLHVWARGVDIVSGWLVVGGSTLMGFIVGFLMGAVAIRRLPLFRGKVLEIEDAT